MNREKEQLDIALELIARTVPLLDELTEQAKGSAISSLALRQDMLMFLAGAGYPGHYLKRRTEEVLRRIAGDSTEIGTFKCEKADEIAPNNKASDRVVCINDSGYPVSLTVGKIYSVIDDKNIEQDEIRIVDDTSGSYIFSKKHFIPLRDEIDEWYSWRGTSEPE